MVRKMKKKMKKQIMESKELPYDCVSKIFSFISPLTPFDVIMFSLVSTVFKTVTDSNSDSVWEKVLPPDYQDFITKSEHDSVDSLKRMSKKALVVHLMLNGIIINNGHMILSLDKHSGKKCFLLRGNKFCKKNKVNLLQYEKASIPRFSRFYDVSGCHMLTAFRFTARMEPRFLTPYTRYGVYLIFKLGNMSHTFTTTISKLRVSFKEAFDLNYWVDRDERPDVPYYQPRTNYPSVPRSLGKEEKEFEIGNFFNVNGKGISPISCLVDEFIQTRDNLSGIILIGIELRPIVD